MFHSDCKVCKREVTSKCKGVACAVCDDWVHLRCTNINTAGYKFLGLANIFWVCNDCLPDFKVNIKNSKIQKDAQKITSKSTTSTTIPTPTTSAATTIPPTTTTTTNPKPSTSSSSHSSLISVTPEARGNKIKRNVKSYKGRCNKVTVVGDSLVRYLGEEVQNRLDVEVKTVCLPGQGVTQVKDRISSLPRDELLIVSVGGNDLGKVGSVEIRNRYKKLIETSKGNNQKCILTGVLPRPRETSEWTSRALSVNEWLHRECLRAEIPFINLWNVMWGRRALFARDGVHLSRFGTSTFADCVSEITSEIVSKDTSFLV